MDAEPTDTERVNAGLTPAQREILEKLRGGDRDRPVFAAALRDEVRARLEEELAPIAGDLGTDLLWIGKSALGRVHACEAHQVAVAGEPFEWSVAAARGTLAHKAIELSVHARGEPTPLDLVDRALDRLADGPDQLAAYLRALDEVDRAELRAAVNELVVKFQELWPPLRRRWLPSTESALRLELFGGRVVLRGRVDLTLGRAHGDRAGKLVVDLKSGGSHAGHLEDLRFYALLETVRVGVPPFRLATYYLDGGTFVAEDVTEGVLEAAMRRTVAGARKLADLQLGLRSPVVTPNPACRWCPAREGCDGARQWEDAAPDRW